MTISQTQKVQRKRDQMIGPIEERRKALDVSFRRLSQEAGLHDGYYRQLISGAFQMPGADKLSALQAALDRLEKLDALNKELRAANE